MELTRPLYKKKKENLSEKPTPKGYPFGEDLEDLKEYIILQIYITEEDFFIPASMEFKEKLYNAKNTQQVDQITRSYRMAALAEM